MTLTTEQTKAIRKTQATLTAIANKESIFFNVARFVNLGLIKAHGKTVDNKTNWVLTEKGQRILNTQL